MKQCEWELCSNLTDNPKYCSLSCGAKYQAKYLMPSWTGTNTCQECGQGFEVTSHTKRKKFCTRNCSAKFNNKARGHKPKTPKEKIAKIKLWLSGEWDGTVSQGLSNTVKRYLIDQAGFRCSSPTCAVPGGFAEINPVTGKCPLEVDHLDGNCYNNTRENLMVVCPNCHALTPTYRALNKNSQRAYRRR